MAWKPLRAGSRTKSWAIREDGYRMGAERHVHPHAEGGIVVAQRLLKFFELGNRFPEQLRVKAPPRFHEALLRGIGVQKGVEPWIGPGESAGRRGQRRTGGFRCLAGGWWPDSRRLGLH